MNLLRGPIPHLPDTIGPLGVADAWRNGPALATLLLTFVVAALLVLLALASGSIGVLPAVSALGLAAGVAAFGAVAAGSQFAEQAGGRPVSSVARAFAGTPLIVLRAVLLAGVLALVLAAFVLVVSLVLLACRLPVVGPVLYVVALPALTLAGAVLLFALSAAALLSMPALWEGHSLRTVLSQLGAIAAQRKLSTFANLLLFFLVAAVVATVVTMFVLAGFGLATGLSVPLVGAASLDAVVAAWTGEARILDAGPYAIAGALAAALVFAITVALLAAVFLFGLTIAYLRSTDGIDIAAARAALGRAIVEIQVTKGQAAEDLEALARRMRSMLGMGAGRATRPAVAAPPVVESQAPACPHCDSSAAPDDVFCGNCGQRLPD